MDWTTAWTRLSFSSFALVSALLRVSTPKTMFTIDGVTLTSACPDTEMERPGCGCAYEAAHAGSASSRAQVARRTRLVMVVPSEESAVSPVDGRLLSYPPL